MEVHMDWRKELEERVGITEEEDDRATVDLNDIEGREFLGEQHLAWLSESGCANMDVASGESDI